MIPFAKKKRLTGDGLKSFLIRHLGFFNSHPYLSSYIIGAVGKMEIEERGEDDILELKSMLMGPLSLLGDQIFWERLKPMLMLSVIFAIIYINYPVITGYRLEIIWVLAVALVAHNLVQFIVRWRGLIWGYSSGTGVLRIITRSRMVKYRLHMGLVAAFIAGLLIVRTYEFNQNNYVFIGALVAGFAGMKLKAPLWVTLLLVFSTVITISFVLLISINP